MPLEIHPELEDSNVFLDDTVEDEVDQELKDQGALQLDAQLVSDVPQVENGQV